MSLQQTIGQQIQVTGVEPFGGNLVDVILKPADTDTGIVFETPVGNIEAKLEYASQYKSAVLLQEKGVKVLHVEHILATLYAYGIDNVRVELKRNLTRSFRVLQKVGLATDVHVVPTFEKREKTLCELLDAAGIQQQSKARKEYVLNGKRVTPRLVFEPLPEMDSHELVMQATTNYPIPGEQTFRFAITPESYRDELSQSRPYAKHVPTWLPISAASLLASIANPFYGLGHGFTPETIFFPVRTKEEWDAKQLYASEDEFARHTIVDRLGALALLAGSLGGRISGLEVAAKYSGHKNDIRVLTTIYDSFRELKKVDAR